MKKRLILMAAAGIFTLAQCALAAPMVVNFANVSGADVTFSDVAGGVDFSFPPNGAGASDFAVTSISGFTGIDVLSGKQGDISGTYAYTTASIVTNGTEQTAPVTGSGQYIIHDGSGFDFTATLSWINIQTLNAGGTFNSLGVVNLSAFSYGGTNADLKQLAATPGGIVVATFQFIPSMSLSALASGCPSAAPCTTSFSGSLTAVPEPSFYGLLALGVLGIVLQGRRRKTA